MKHNLLSLAWLLGSLAGLGVLGYYAGSLLVATGVAWLDHFQGPGTARAQLLGAVPVEFWLANAVAVGGLAVYLWLLRAWVRRVRHVFSGGRFI